MRAHASARIHIARRGRLFCTCCSRAFVLSKCDDSDTHRGPAMARLTATTYYFDTCRLAFVRQPNR